MSEAEAYKELILQQVEDGDKTPEQVIATASNPRFSDRTGPVQQGYIAAAEEIQRQKREGK